MNQGSILPPGNPALRLAQWLLLPWLLSLTLAYAAALRAEPESPGYEALLMQYASEAQSKEDKDIIESIRRLTKPEGVREDGGRSAIVFRRNLHNTWVVEVVEALYRANPEHAQIQDMMTLAIAHRPELTRLQRAIPVILRHGDSIAQQRLIEFITEHPQARPGDWVTLLEGIVLSRNEPAWYMSDVRRKALHLLMQADEGSWAKRQIYEVLLSDLDGELGIFRNEENQYSIAEEVLKDGFEILLSFYGSTELFWEQAIRFCQSVNCFDVLDGLAERYAIPASQAPLLEETTLAALEQAALRNRNPDLNRGHLQSRYRLLARCKSAPVSPPLPDYALVSARSEDYLPMLHHAYGLWANVSIGVPIRAPLSTWMAQIMRSADNGYGRDMKLAALELLARVYIANAPSPSAALPELIPLFTLAEASGAYRKKLLQSAIAAVGQDDASEWFVTNLLELSSGQPELILAILGELSHQLVDEPVPAWGLESHELLKQLSQNTPSGNYRAGKVGGTVREYAWGLRIRIFKDELPRAEAITMDRWRTSTLIEVSFERYFYVGLSLLLPLGLMLLRPRHPWVPMTLSLLPPIIVFGGIMLLSLLGSIGHNHANMQGYLAVLQGGLPVFMVVAAGVWWVGLLELWRWFRPRGQSIDAESAAKGETDSMGLQR